MNLDKSPFLRTLHLKNEIKPFGRSFVCVCSKSLHAQPLPWEYRRQRGISWQPIPNSRHADVYTQQTRLISLISSNRLNPSLCDISRNQNISHHFAFCHGRLMSRHKCLPSRGCSGECCPSEFLFQPHFHSQTNRST